MQRRVSRPCRPVDPRSWMDLWTEPQSVSQQGAAHPCIFRAIFSGPVRHVEAYFQSGTMAQASLKKGMVCAGVMLKVQGSSMGSSMSGT